MSRDELRMMAAMIASGAVRDHQASQGKKESKLNFLLFCEISCKKASPAAIAQRCVAIAQAIEKELPDGSPVWSITVHEGGKQAPESPDESQQPAATDT